MSGRFSPLTAYPFTPEKSTTLAVVAAGVIVNLTLDIRDTARANVLLVANTGLNAIYYNFVSADAAAPTLAGVFPDGDAAIAPGAVMTIPIGPGVGASTIFYTLSGLTSTLLLSRGWGA